MWERSHIGMNRSIGLFAKSTDFGGNMHRRPLSQKKQQRRSDGAVAKVLFSVLMTSGYCGLLPLAAVYCL